MCSKRVAEGIFVRNSAQNQNMVQIVTNMVLNRPKTNKLWLIFFVKPHPGEATVQCTENHSVCSRFPLFIMVT